MCWSADSAILSNVFNYPNRGFGLKTLERIAESADQHKISPFQAVEKGKVKLSESQERVFQSFKENIIQLGSSPITSPDEIFQLCRDIIKKFSLDNPINFKGTQEKQKRKKIELIHSLPTWFKSMYEDLADGEESPGLQDLIDMLTLSDEKPRKNQDQNESTISLMTVHKSKGLEFPIVFMSKSGSASTSPKKCVGGVAL